MIIERFGVVGCGLMGSGIAEVAARSGCDVKIVENNDGALQAGMQRIEKSLDRAMRAGKLSEEDHAQDDDRPGRIFGKKCHDGQGSGRTVLAGTLGDGRERLNEVSPAASARQVRTNFNLLDLVWTRGNKFIRLSIHTY